VPVGCMALQGSGVACRVILLNPMRLPMGGPPVETADGFLFHMLPQRLPANLGLLASNADWRCFARFEHLASACEVAAVWQESSAAISVHLLLDAAQKDKLRCRLLDSPPERPAAAPGMASVAAARHSLSEIRRLPSSLQRRDALRTFILGQEQLVLATTDTRLRAELVTRLRSLAEFVCEEMAEAAGETAPTRANAPYSGSSSSRLRSSMASVKSGSTTGNSGSPSRNVTLSRLRGYLASGSDAARRSFFLEALDLRAPWWPPERAQALLDARAVRALAEPLPHASPAAPTADAVSPAFDLRLQRASFFARDKPSEAILQVDAPSTPRTP